MSSAYSDDGQRHRIRVYDLQAPISEHVEPDTGVSITAELSDHRFPRVERPDEDDAPIYEQPNESENASSPPGSLDDIKNNDVVSEQIKTNIKKFGKSYNKPFTVMQHQDNVSNDSVSKEAHQSEVTIVSKIAAVSPAVAVPETSRSILTFNLQYDKLYAEFHQELVMEYAQMRGCYMGEFQSNYD